MSRVLSELPSPHGRVFAARAPRWLTRLLRLASLGFGCATLWFSAHDCSRMPVWSRWLTGALVPAFFLMALHPRGWARLSSVPFFRADEVGMCFPSHRNDERGRAPRWLFVPWEAISDVRVDRCFAGLDGSDADGTRPCAAFDVGATPDEVEEFFVCSLTTKRPARDGSVSVAFYVHSPPHPREIVRNLVALQGERRRPAAPGGTRGGAQTPA